VQGLLLIQLIFIMHRKKRMSDQTKKNKYIDQQPDQDKDVSLPNEELDDFQHSVVTILESIPDAFILYDQQWRVTYINMHGEELLGRTRQELLGKNIWEQFPAYSGSTYEAKSHESIEKNVSLEFEEFCAQREKWFIIRTYPSPEGLSVYLTDISERKRAELERNQLLAREQAAQHQFEELAHQLEKERERLQLAQRSAHIGIFEWFIPENHIIWMPELEALYGLPPGGFEGKYENWRSRVHPDDIQRAEENIATALDSGPSFNVEFRVIWPDKSIHWMLARGDVYFDGQHMPCRMVGVNIDITAHKQAEEKLRQSEERYRLVVEHSSDTIILFDMQGKVLYASPSSLQVIGYTAEELANMNVLDLVHPDDLEQTHSEMTKAGAREIAHTAFRARHKNGRWVVLEITGTAIPDEKGQPYMLVFTIHDITERTELEQRKDEFIGMASHELKTPVTSIKGFTQVLQRRFQKRDDQESLRYLSIMDSQLNKLTKLISDLLDISKMQAGKLIYRKDFFDLNALTHEILENIQETTQTHQLVLEKTAHVQVFGDKDRIGQVLINVLTNAIKYSPEADKVFICISKDQGYVSVKIQDFGIGIAETHQAKIFERFYQVTEAEEKNFSGLGIGLYISHEIIKRHHGRMWVESQKGKGATFSFKLPLKEG
jgi:PAS domain S-box-containing protein